MLNILSLDLPRFQDSYFRVLPNTLGSDRQGREAAGHSHLLPSTSHGSGVCQLTVNLPAAFWGANCFSACKIAMKI